VTSRRCSRLVLPFDGDLGRQRCTGLRINAANLHPWTVTLPRRAPRLRVIQVSGSPIIDDHDARWGHGVVSREEPQHHLLLPSSPSLCDFAVLKTGSHHRRRTGDADRRQNNTLKLYLPSRFFWNSTSLWDESSFFLTTEKGSSLLSQMVGINEFVLFLKGSCLE